jgi:pyruvate/2-oxoglutarate dehydrogenase complex dihydrolipoamide dehydrogenase (E3) component
VAFRLQTSVTGLARATEGVRIAFFSAGMANEMTSRQVCAAVGHRFHPRTIGAARIGLEMGRLGLRTNAHLATSVPHIYAAGDAAGNRQLSTVAAYEGRIAALNALRGDTERADEAVIPQVLSTTPGRPGRRGLRRGAAHGVRRGGPPRRAGQQLQRRHRRGRGLLQLVFDRTPAARRGPDGLARRGGADPALRAAIRARCPRPGGAQLSAPAGPTT